MCPYYVFCVTCFQHSTPGSCLSLRVSCLARAPTPLTTYHALYVSHSSACVSPSSWTTHGIIITYIHIALRLRDSGYSTVFLCLPLPLLHGVLRAAIITL
ncbi:hypothetical protein L226DRAFT_322495 [Lentinus tigrinus ALCF2SS1-7]|uniref:uncharacterized protein n=1 Tax=Lentinus tigrinus ALCF2SS1-7 TaxID=1328758 RepID=UPI0011661CBF|nr:hypothetical protein L226DRAFT_322495 [Lentinus tigrinus ALCF2SS1-7]